MSTAAGAAPAPAGRGAFDPLFRFGFLCAPADGPELKGVGDSRTASWRSLVVADLVVHHHPEALATVHEAHGGHAVLIGEAFAEDGEVAPVLDGLLRDTPGERFFETLDSLSGRFALLVAKGDARWALHDPIGSRSLYYRTGPEPCVGSHAELVATAFGHGRSADAAAILASEEYRSRAVRYLPGDLTVYEGVHGLAPNNYYDLAAGRTVRYWPRAPRRDTTFEEFAEALDRHLRALAGHLGGRHEPVLGVTGGIDTRTMIAAFASTGQPFSGITWVRRAGALEDREREVIEALVAHGGFEHSELDLSGLDEGERRLARLAKRNAGRFGLRSRIAARMAGHVAGSNAAFVRGYGAEIVRGFYNLPVASASAARARRGAGIRSRIGRRLARLRTRPVAVTGPEPERLLRAYDSSMRLPRAGREHQRLALAAFEGFARRAHYDGRLAGWGHDLSDLFYWEHRMGLWGSTKLNEMDVALPALAGFNSRRAYEAAFGLPPAERLTKELLRRAIARYDGELAEIPYI